MKKLLFALVAVMMSLTAMAGGVKVTNGEKDFFQKTNGTALVVINTKGASVEGEKIDDSSDLDKWVKTARADFAEKFNGKTKNKDFSVVTSGNANYKITIKMTKMEWDDKLMSVVPGLCTKIWGTVTVTDSKSGKVVFSADIEKVDGGNNPSAERSFCDAFQKLGELLAKLK